MFSFARNFFWLPGSFRSHSNSLNFRFLRRIGDQFNRPFGFGIISTHYRILESNPDSAGFMNMHRNIRQQSQMTRSFYRYRYCSLMLGASAGLAMGINLAAIRNKLTQF
jgi:hypothetical protein